MPSDAREQLADVLDQIKGRLADYLSQFGHSPNEVGKFCCIHPAHDDKNPSAGVIPANPHVWHCHGCGVSGDIFRAAEYLEGLPARGPKFITETVEKLSERFGIPFDALDIIGSDPEALKRHKLLEIMQDSANILVRFGSFEHGADRAWTPETCKMMGVGSIAWNKMSDEIQKFGWNSEDLDEAGIDRRLFASTRLTFTIRDRWGRVTGFAARNLEWKKGDRDPKYFNTPSRVPIFTKKNNLYNFHNIPRGCSKVTVCEGYADVVTAAQHGMPHVVAVCSSSISHEQIDLMVDQGVREAILCLDADDVGRSSTKKALTDIFGARSDIRVSVLDLQGPADSQYQCDQGPERKEGHCDLDELLRMYGTIPKDIQTENAFGWTLKQIDEEETPEDICTNLIPVIVTEPSNVRRELMAKQLADFTGIREVAIQRDLDSIIKSHDTEIEQRANLVRDTLVRSLKRANPNGISDLLDEAQGKLTDINQSLKPQDRFNVGDTLEHIGRTKEAFHRSNGELRGLDTGFKSINKSTMGIPRRSRLIGIPAQPNVGKTGLVIAIAWNTLERNDDHIVLHFSIDDARDAVLARLVAMDAGVDIDMVTQPSKANNQQRRVIDASWERVKKYIESGRYDLRDASQGTTLDYLSDWCQHVHEANPGKPILVVFDNFHKLQGEGGDERTKFKSASQRLQRMKHDTKLGQPTVLATMELIKTPGRQAGVFDIAETNQILYDADLVMMMHSDFMGSGEDAKNYWEYTPPQGGELQIQPMIKVTVEKNKISGWKGVFWLKFLAPQSRFFEASDYRGGPC